MLLSQMRDHELAAQVQSETAVKIRQKIVRILRARRLAGNIQLEVMAAEIGRHPITMTRIERGTTEAKDSTLAKMLAFYGTAWTPTARVFTAEAKVQKRRAE